jgi:hypothetical protein
LAIISFDYLQSGRHFLWCRRAEYTGWDERALLTGVEFEGVRWWERAEMDERSEGGF